MGTAGGEFSSKTIQDMRRWSNPSILLTVYAHSRMDKRLEAQGKMIAAMGLNKKTARHLIQLGVGDQGWVILITPDHHISGKSFRIMVARDGFGRNYTHTLPISTVIRRS